MGGVVNSIMAAQLEIVYNGTSSDIAKGTGLTFGTTVYNVADPTPGTGTTSPVIGVVACADHEQDFIGVAREILKAGSCGIMCRKGKCECLFPASGACTAGDAIVCNSSGTFVTQNTDVSDKAGIVLETFTSLSAAALKWCYITDQQGALGRKAS